ncbi:protoporphyrinogen oxidase [Microbacterium aoyamense]|uniref:Protoporphyrinogen oxidase n=1 Tax=Microbacterium aoyamense TaxID=344166 RepID=A0ABN2Q0R8_9MICO|nr:FAD-dependent oxidoreductase [Microbacterium aoyamense]
MASDAIVVGGGVAGLVAARRLALGGRRVVLLERSDHLGGQVVALPIAGVDLDAAAESYATRGGAVAALAAELGLGDDLVTPTPAPAWLHRADGTAVPLPATGVLGIPGHPLAPDVVRAIGRPAALRAWADRLLPRRRGADAASLDDLVRARMGAGVADGLVAPIVRGVHSKEPRDLTVDTASPRLRAELAARGSLAGAVRALRAQAPAGSQVGGIRGGMHRLVTALARDAERLGVDIRTGVDIGRVTADAVEADGERLVGTVVRAFAEPADDQRRLTLVTLVLEAPALDAAPRGTGLLVAAGAPGIRARALTHLTAKWAWVAEALPGRHAVRLSYDGDPADPVGQATRDAATLLGVRIDSVLDSAVRTWDRGVRTPDDDIVSVGEGAAGTGLASVVAQAERTAAEVLTAG